MAELEGGGEVMVEAQKKRAVVSFEVPGVLIAEKVGKSVTSTVRIVLGIDRSTTASVRKCVSYNGKGRNERHEETRESHNKLPGTFLYSTATVK